MPVKFAKAQNKIDMSYKDTFSDQLNNSIFVKELLKNVWEIVRVSRTARPPTHRCQLAQIFSTIKNLERRTASSPTIN